MIDRFTESCDCDIAQFGEHYAHVTQKGYVGMYMMEIIEQVALALTVTYYGSHLKQQITDYWEKSKDFISERIENPKHARSILIFYFAFFLHGCVEIGPLAFYGLHFYSKLMGH